MEEDQQEHLQHASKEDIATFLMWMLDTYPRLRKRSSVHQYWRQWRMLYRKLTGQHLLDEIREEINDVSTLLLSIYRYLE